MPEISIFIPMIPKGKGRPRTSFKLGHVYTPTETRTAEAEVSTRARVEMLSKGLKMPPRGCPVKVVFTAWFPLTKSMTKKQREEALSGAFAYTKKPDLDNVEKLILDALNGVCYEDDSQVIYTTGKKRYINRQMLLNEETEGLTVTVTWPYREEE